MQCETYSQPAAHSCKFYVKNLPKKVYAFMEKVKLRNGAGQMIAKI